MINLKSLNRQHTTILSEINIIITESERPNQSINTAQAALHICKLAGQLNLHLMNEDKFLYPNLLKCSDHEIQGIANQYILDMGNLATKYIAYKNSYNTKSKIDDNLDSFVKDTKITMEALKNRISREDDGLYKLVADRNL